MSRQEVATKALENVPNACTLMNGACGIVALMIAVFHKSHDAIHIACILIGVGAFFDTIDGRLARRLKLTSAIGKELDSFSDLITFALAPICVFLSLHSVGQGNHVSLPEILVATIYISCAMYRLARYNVADYTSYFVGLPTTSAGLILGLYTCISNQYIENWAGNMLYTYSSYILILLLGFAMISRVQVKRI